MDILYQVQKIHICSWFVEYFFLNFIYLFIYLFIYVFIYFYFWLCWVFISVRGLFLVVASGGHSSSWCVGLSLSWPLSLWSTSSRCAGSVVVVHGPSCSAACGIFPDQGSNPCPLHWQADSQPLCHQWSPVEYFYHERVLGFVKCFFCSNWDDHVVVVFYHIKMVYYIVWFLYVEPILNFLRLITWS